jgi:hypothetical protein
VDFALLANFARARFVEGASTVTLLQASKTSGERDAIIAVSMLHLPKTQLQTLCKLNGRDCEHAMACGEATRKKLRRLGILVPVHPLEFSR